MKKLLSLGLIFVFTTMLLAACGNNNNNNTTQEPTTQEPATQEPGENNVDAVTTASVVDNEEAFLNAISKDGTWIIAALNDLKFDQDLVLEGEFKNKDVITRKIALYSQDAERNKTASFTLTAPKLTVKSENAIIQGGTFVGDIYVEAKGFSIVDAKVEGNVYFASEELKSSYEATNNATVTGETEVKQ